MRNLVLLSILFTSSVFAHDAAPGHENKPAAAVPVQTNDVGAVYGAVLPAVVPASVDISTVALDPAAHLGKPAAFGGRITQVCQKMGCWLVLTGDKGELARVTMHDHAFGVPKDASGAAIVYGTLSEKTLSAAEIEHLKKDGALAPAERELQIDAVSVLIVSKG